MKKHQVEARIDDHGGAGKLVFRRKRSRELKAVEEVLAGGLSRARTPKDKRYVGQVRFRIVGLYVAGRRVQRFFNTLTEAQTVASRCPAAQTGHVGLGSAFIEKGKPPRLQPALPPLPALPCETDVFAVLLGCAERLFLYVSPMSTST
jgi:hypothetical protein